MKRLMICLMLLWLLPAGARADFEAKFLLPGQEEMITEDAYRSQDTAVELTRMRVNDSDVYIADIYLRSVEQLQRGFSGGAWAKSASYISTIAEENNAIIAITGDSSQNFSAGWVVGNGTIYRSTPNRKRDLCIIRRSGEMLTLQAEEIDHEALAAASEDIWHTLLFGPVLLDAQGHALTDFSDSNVKYANPRSVIGYYEPGHYCLVQVDGRGTRSALAESAAVNEGMTLEQLALLMESLGCKAAYNLDGGQSAAMWFCGEVISTPYGGGRGIGDIVMVTSGTSSLFSAGDFIPISPPNLADALRRMPRLNRGDT